MTEPTESAATQDPTTAERISDRELIVRRTVSGPAHLVWRAWTEPELFRQWWVPKAFGLTLTGCELDVRVGGRYRLEFLYEGATMAFVGTYLEVEPATRLVWTNEEDGNETITTVTFEAVEGGTRVVVHDLYASKEALDEAILSGSVGAMPEQLDQLDTLLSGLSA